MREYIPGSDAPPDEKTGQRSRPWGSRFGAILAAAGVTILGCAREPHGEPDPDIVDVNKVRPNVITEPVTNVFDVHTNASRLEREERR